MSDQKTVVETSGIKIVSKPPEETRNFKGGFFTLRAANLVDPLDEALYSAHQKTMLKSQGMVLVFSLFWAHLVDKGSFFKPGQSKIPFYAVAVGLPAAIHAFYSTSSITKVLADLDEKYAPKYAKYYSEKIQSKDQKL